MPTDQTVPPDGELPTGPDRLPLLAYITGYGAERVPDAPDDFEDIPQWYRDLAAKIHSLVDQPGMMTRFRDKLREWSESKTRPIVLRSVPDPPLSLLEKYAILSAIHDTGWKGEKIDLWPDPPVSEEIHEEADRLRSIGDEEGAQQLLDNAWGENKDVTIESVPYWFLLNTVQDVPESDVPFIESILANVERDVCEDAGTESAAACNSGGLAGNDEVLAAIADPGKQSATKEDVADLKREVKKLRRGEQSDGDGEPPDDIEYMDPETFDYLTSRRAREPSRYPSSKKPGKSLLSKSSLSRWKDSCPHLEDERGIRCIEREVDGKIQDVFHRGDLDEICSKLEP